MGLRDASASKKLAGSSVLKIMRNQQKKKSPAHIGKLVMQ